MLYNEVYHGIHALTCQMFLMRIYDIHLKNYADGDGRITGNDAVKFFSLSQLSRPELKQVRASSIVSLVGLI